MSVDALKMLMLKLATTFFVQDTLVLNHLFGSCCLQNEDTKVMIYLRIY